MDFYLIFPRINENLIKKIKNKKVFDVYFFIKDPGSVLSLGHAQESRNHGGSQKTVKKHHAFLSPTQNQFQYLVVVGAGSRTCHFHQRHSFEALRRR